MPNLQDISRRNTEESMSPDFLGGAKRFGKKPLKFARNLLMLSIGAEGLLDKIDPKWKEKDEPVKKEPAYNYENETASQDDEENEITIPDELSTFIKEIHKSNTRIEEKLNSHKEPISDIFKDMIDPIMTDDLSEDSHLNLDRDILHNIATSSEQLNEKTPPLKESDEDKFETMLMQEAALKAEEDQVTYLELILEEITNLKTRFGIAFPIGGRSGSGGAMTTAGNMALAATGGAVVTGGVVATAKRFLGKGKDAVAKIPGAIGSAVKPGSIGSKLLGFGKTGAKFLGRSALPVAAGLSTYELMSERRAIDKLEESGELSSKDASNKKFKATSSIAGGLAGGLGGAKAGAVGGAALGSIVPVVGTAIGGLLGAALGGLAGYYLGDKAGGIAGDIRNDYKNREDSIVAKLPPKFSDPLSGVSSTALSTSSATPGKPVHQNNIDYTGDDARFHAADAPVKASEGGYVNDPDDPGGETNHGISKKAYPNLDIKNLTAEEAAKIRKRDYWDKGNVEKLPANMQAIYYDAAINQGLGFAKKAYAESGDNPEAFHALRQQKYESIVANKPSQEKYLNGWTKRNNESLRFTKENAENPAWVKSSSLSPSDFNMSPKINADNIKLASSHDTSTSNHSGSSTQEAPNINVVAPPATVIQSPTKENIIPQPFSQTIHNHEPTISAFINKRYTTFVI